MKRHLIHFYYELLNCSEVVIFEYFRNTSEYLCTHKSSEMKFKKNDTLITFLEEIHKPIIKNSVYVNDILGKEMKLHLNLQVRNYIVVPLRNYDEAILGYLVFINKMERKNERCIFSKMDKMLSYISQYLYLICIKMTYSIEQMEKEKLMKTQSFMWTVQLVSSIRQSSLIETMERQLIQLIDVERANAVLYDLKRNELFKRLNKDNEEILISNSDIDWNCNK